MVQPVTAGEAWGTCKGSVAAASASQQKNRATGQAAGMSES
jgi:hypothetical protein